MPPGSAAAYAKLIKGNEDVLCTDMYHDEAPRPSFSPVNAESSAAPQEDTEEGALDGEGVAEGVRDAGKAVPVGAHGEGMTLGDAVKYAALGITPGGGAAPPPRLKLYAGSKVRFFRLHER